MNTLATSGSSLLLICLHINLFNCVKNNNCCYRHVVSLELRRGARHRLEDLLAAHDVLPVALDRRVVLVLERVPLVRRLWNTDQTSYTEDVWSVFQR